jgi:hypothetical protein
VRLLNQFGILTSTVEEILKGTKIKMQMRNLDGKQAVFTMHSIIYTHQCRWKKCLCTHIIVRLNSSRSRKQRNWRFKYFEYTEHQLFHRMEAVVYQTTAAVPTSWNWIYSTGCFLTLILNTIDKDAPDHYKKEDYAFRFLILFVPFRSREDLETDKFYYQGALRRAHREGRISEEMIQITQKIQTLPNSLASNVVQNHKRRQ